MASVSFDRTPIRSAAHSIAKHIRAVRRGRAPEVVLVEGDRLVDDALGSGFVPEIALVSEEHEGRAEDLVTRGVPVRLASAELVSSLSALATSPGSLALFAAPRARSLDELEPGSEALVAVVCGVQDPGNLGAIARTAEAAGAVGLVIVAGGCRPWNEKALRGSMGSLLRLPVWEVSTGIDAWRGLRGRGFRHVVAATRGGCAPGELDWSGPVALWVPSETGGLPADVETARASEPGDDLAVTIPMAGAVESLNVSVATGVLLFAAGRTEVRR